jgi:predicted TIM-barrel fold metal-dependent hydrolase
LKFLDAHHHFWDISSNYHPWLCDEPQIPFRYGNYAAIRTNYLPMDYASDTAEVEIIGSVHIEAEWNPEDPVGETRWLTDITQTCKHPVVFVVQACLDQDNIGKVLADHSAFPQVRGIRQKPTATEQNALRPRGLPGSMDDPNWRDGYAKLERLGYSFDLQIPYWHLDQAADLPRLTLSFMGTLPESTASAYENDRHLYPVCRHRFRGNVYCRYTLAIDGLYPVRCM